LLLGRIAATFRTVSHPLGTVGFVMTLHLRYALLIALEPVGVPRKVAEIVVDVQAAGVDLGARPSKRVSDLLRTECNMGRVERVGWGTYRLVRFPRRTRGRAIVALDAYRRVKVAAMRPAP
jgi:hypothetical protein